MDRHQRHLQSQMFSHPLTVAEEDIADELEEIGITAEEAEEASMKSEKGCALEAVHATVHGIGPETGIRN